MQTLYLIRGLPGSGKSTLAYNLMDAGLANNYYEADMYFINGHGEYQFDSNKLHKAHEWCQYQCKFDLELGFDVIVSNTSTSEKEVETYRKIAEETGSQFVSLIVENRHEGKNVHNVPEEKIQQMKNRFSIKL
jgi:predicted kinase